MDKIELLAFLKENLTIGVVEEATCGNSQEFRIELFLEEAVISTDYFEIDMPN